MTNEHARAFLRVTRPPLDPGERAAAKQAIAEELEAALILAEQYRWTVTHHDDVRVVHFTGGLHLCAVPEADHIAFGDVEGDTTRLVRALPSVPLIYDHALGEVCSQEPDARGDRRPAVDVIVEHLVDLVRARLATSEQCLLLGP